MKSNDFEEGPYKTPLYDPRTYYLDIADSPYFRELIKLRHCLKSSIDKYWSEEQGAYSVDLFMMTPSVSSPIAPGSDSEVMRIRFGDSETFLVDSSQFGFEPILMNGIDKVYCYLPSMRGEDPDERHLNQFYHCEAEIAGTLESLIPQIEEFIRVLCGMMISRSDMIKHLSEDGDRSLGVFKKIIASTEFRQIEFDDAVTLLKNNGFSECVKETSTGRDILSSGEARLFEILKIEVPIWLKHYDRDRTAFYQKPIFKGGNKVINADLLFPSIIPGSFSGEVVGSGQRQDDADEIIESLKRQQIDSSAYEWYINLRRQANYRITSGFGLGIERFIAWALGKRDIKDVILYPRLKNRPSLP